MTITSKQFLAWYKDKRVKAAGLCAWCGDAFGDKGPAMNYDRLTGQPRALVCFACGRVESYGVERLRRVVAAVEAWETGRTAKAAAIPVSFERWAKLVEKAPGEKDAKMAHVVRQIKKQCTSDEDVEMYYERFVAFLNERKVTGA